MVEDRRILINTTLRWAGEIINKAVWFVFIIILARKLGSSGFGYFNYAFSFGSLLVVCTDLGTNIYLIKEISRDPSKTSYYLGNIFALKILFSVIIGVIGFVLPKESPQVAVAVNLFTLSLIVSAFLDPLNSLYRAKKQMQYETAVMLIWRILIVGLSLLAIFLISGTLNVVAGAFLAAAVLSVAVSAYIAHHAYRVPLFPLRDIKIENWKELTGGALVLGILLIISGIFFKLNVILLQYLSSSQEVGWYGAAYKLVEGTFFVPSIFVGSLFPFLCESNSMNGISDKGFGLFKKAFGFLFGLAFIVALLATVFSRTIITSLYGSPFVPAADALRILVWALLFIYVNELFMYLYLSINRQNSVLKIMIITSVAYMLLCVILIPARGFLGAAWVLLLSQAILFGFNLLLLRKVR